MKSEIEAKFLNVDYDAVRQKLTDLGATLVTPRRLMRRVVIHTSEMTDKNAFVRIRDEGYRTTVTYKQFDDDSVDGAKEFEVEVSDFEVAVNLFAAAGLVYDSFQESYRENWQLGEVEVMLDEWPWLNPYLEVEATNEEAVKEIAAKLGYEWSKAIFGGVANVYREQYPHIGAEGSNEINQNWAMIRFAGPRPQLLET